MKNLGVTPPMTIATLLYRYTMYTNVRRKTEYMSENYFGVRAIHQSHSDKKAIKSRIMD